jgi:flavin-binding protein dodecin
MIDRSMHLAGLLGLGVLLSVGCTEETSSTSKAPGTASTTGGTSGGTRRIILLNNTESPFWDAARAGIAKAAETLENITGAWVMDQSVKVKKGKIVEYEVRMRLTFILK